MPELSDQIAVVTGAARGIGAAISRNLAALGATVVLVARDRECLSEVEASIEAAGGHAKIALVDLLDDSAIAGLGRLIEQEHGRCDILVNNAGMGEFGRPLHEMDPASWDRTMATNLGAP